MIAALRDALGSAEPLPPPPKVPEIPAPPARVYSPRPEVQPFAAEAAKHTTALVGIGHVGTRYATDVVLEFQAELAVARNCEESCWKLNLITPVGSVTVGVPYKPVSVVS